MPINLTNNTRSQRLCPRPTSAIQASADILPVCESCKFIAKIVKHSLHDQDIEKAGVILEQYCGKLTNPDAKKACQDYAKLIVISAEYLLNHSPEEFCINSGACPPETMRFLSENLQGIEDIEQALLVATSNSQDQKARSPVACEGCQLAIKELQQLLRNPKIVANIDRNINVICDHISHKDTHQCKEVLTAYVHEFIKFIDDQAPRDVCTILGQCGPFEDEPILLSLAKGSAPGSTFICETCNNTVQEIKDRLLNPKQIAKVQELIEQTCLIFPAGDLRQECLKFSKDELSKYVVQFLNTENKEICKKVGLC